MEDVIFVNLITWLSISMKFLDHIDAVFINERYFILNFENG